MSRILKIFIAKVYNVCTKYLEAAMQAYLRDKFALGAEVFFNNPLQTKLHGNITIGEGTYFNSGRILTGKKSKIVIGKHCAIGHNVNISSITHDSASPTGPFLRHLERDIIIEDEVWIGSNVFIRDGVTIEKGAIIGANSVVVKDVAAMTIVGGVPAKMISKRSSD